MENHQNTKGFHISQKTLSNEFEKKRRLKFMGQIYLEDMKTSVLEILMENHQNTKGFHISQKTLSNEFGKKDVGNLLDKIFLEDNVVQ